MRTPLGHTGAGKLHRIHETPLLRLQETETSERYRSFEVVVRSKTPSNLMRQCEAQAQVVVKAPLMWLEESTPTMIPSESQPFSQAAGAIGGRIGARGAIVITLVIPINFDERRCEVTHPSHQIPCA